jgi:hypothetical protein
LGAPLVTGNDLSDTAPLKNRNAATAQPERKHGTAPERRSTKEQVVKLMELLRKGIPAFKKSISNLTSDRLEKLQLGLNELLTMGVEDQRFGGTPPANVGVFHARVRNALNAVKETKVGDGLVKGEKGAGGAALLSNGTKTSGGTPVSMTDANKVVARITAGWAKTVQRPHLAPTFRSLAPDVQQAIRDEGGDHTTQGIYHNGVIHIILENHTSERALEETIYHEGAHLGTLVELGKDVMSKLSRAFDKLGGFDGLSKLAEKYGKLDRFKNYHKGFLKQISEAQKLGQNEKNAAVEKARAGLVAETLAMMAEVTPYQKLSDQIKTLIKEFIGAVRNALKKMGLTKLSELGETDMLYLISQGNKRLTTGGKPVKGIPAFLMTLSTEIHNALGKEGIAATHDSPIRHEGKFNWREHKGKGEGNASFGAGTYLSTADGVHRSYKNQFTAQMRYEAGAGLKTDPKYMALKEQLAALYKQGIVPGEKVSELTKQMFAMEDAAKPGKSPTYHVTVNAKPEELLDWDTLLSEQVNIPVIALKKAMRADLSKTIRDSGSDTTPHSVQHNGINYSARQTRPNTFVFTSDKDENPENYKWTEVSEDEYLDAWKNENSGADAYTLLSHTLGSQAAASDYLQSLGIVGHKYASDGGENDKHPNYVIYDDSRIDTNYVHFNAQQAGEKTAPTDAEKSSLRAKAVKMLGKDIRLAFAKLIKGDDGTPWSGEWMEMHIRIALGAADKLGILNHEAAHQLFSWLRQHGGVETQALLERVATSAIMQKKLAALLSDHKHAIEQLKDPEEAVAYMFQFWSAIGEDGKPLLTVGPQIETLFDAVKYAVAKAALLIRKHLFGSEDAATALKSIADAKEINNLFAAFSDGAFAAKPDAAVQAIEKHLAARREAAANSLLDKLIHNKFFDQAVYTAASALEDTKIPSLIEISRKLHTPPGGEMGEKQGLYAAVAQMKGKKLNDLSKILKDADPNDLLVANKYLQSRTELKDIHAPHIRDMVRDIREYLVDMHAYMVKKDIRRFDEKTNEWVKPGEITDNYFPAVMDIAELVERQDEFIQRLLEKHPDQLEAIAKEANEEVKNGKDAGEFTASATVKDREITKEDIAMAIFQRIITSGGAVESNESSSSLGMTPYAKSVNRRTLWWLDHKEFTDFMSKDLVQTMTNYTAQIIKRGEYTERFGYDGSEMQNAVENAYVHMLVGEERLPEVTAKHDGCQSASNTFHLSASNIFHFLGLLRPAFALLEPV